ncbi:MAG TPA: carbohydrate-binding protein [Chitinophagaceae bacterium]|nr:carbohydrate-binding protein [Chitinophagaceae bacterium]
MGGPVYHYSKAAGSASKLPAYYDKALFVYDWMRNWVFALRFDENNNYKSMEQFMKSNGDFRRPVDIEFGPDGTMYMLEYGSVYGVDNEDARLVRIDYNPGNRAPVAKITTKDTIGLAPFKASFNSAASYDYDEDDKLTYAWSFEGSKVSSTSANPTYTFTKNGIYHAVLRITDPSGQSSTDSIVVKVGNTSPRVVINTAGNSTFFFEKTTRFNYNVTVEDDEDALIDKQNLRVTMKYIAKLADNQRLMGHQVNEDFNLGRNLVASSDCKACHQLNAKSVGPSFMDISLRYKNQKNAVGYLANKIIMGGGGVWGEHAMSAHPQLSKEETSEMVKYVLAVSNTKAEADLPQKGSVLLGEHKENPDEGRYIFSATYTDQGGAITPLAGKFTLLLRPAKVLAAEANVLSNMIRQGTRLGGINNKSYFVLKNIDLKDVTSLTYNYASRELDAAIEVHADSLNGELISTAEYKSTTAWNKPAEVTAAISDPGGKHDLYFVFVKNEEPNRNLAVLNWVRFEGRKDAGKKRVRRR